MTFQHDLLLVFDIETIPDVDAVSNLFGNVGKGIEARRQALSKYHLNVTHGKSDFLRLPFHRVVAISFLEAELDRHKSSECYTLRDIRSAGLIDSSERELLSEFFGHLELTKPRLVSYNGRSFDLPVLKYRAMVHGIAAFWLHQGGDKWNSYSSRYSQDWHCDLLDVMSDYGASGRVKLNEVCAAFGFPGKFGQDGSQVTEMFDAGQIKEIRDYCETDVMNTWLVYLRYMHHRGTLPTDDYNRAVEETIASLKADKEEKPHFWEFYEAWGEACKDSFYL